MRQILVTGAEGYLGRKVLYALAESGHDVVGASRTNSGNNSRVIACDLADRRMVKDKLKHFNPQAIVHCAATRPRSREDYQAYAFGPMDRAIATNLLSLKARHIIFTSSMTVYDTGGDEPAKESDTGANISEYGRSKLELESVFLHGEPQSTVIRLPGLFGLPREDGLLCNAALAFAADQDFPLPHDRPLWSAMHVDDATTLIVHLVDHAPRANIVLNAGYPEKMSVADAVVRIASRFDRRVEVDDMAPWFVMDLTRQSKFFGRHSQTFDERLDQLVDWAKCRIH